MQSKVKLLHKDNANNNSNNDNNNNNNTNDGNQTTANNESEIKSCDVNDQTFKDEAVMKNHH